MKRNESKGGQYSEEKYKRGGGPKKEVKEKVKRKRVNANGNKCLITFKLCI